MSYVALVRGINVGRANQVAMSDLRGLVQSLGFEDVRTLLRSGNIVFRGSPAAPTPTASPEAIAGPIEQAIVDRLRMRASVVVRTAEELAAVVASNPIPEAARSGTFLHVMFLAGPLTAAERTAIGAENFHSDTVRLAEREIYVWYRNGMSGSDTAGRLGKPCGRSRPIATGTP